MPQLATIFFNNYTTLTFKLVDFDNNSYGTIYKKLNPYVNQYSILLPYSSSFRKSFRLVDPLSSKSVTFHLNKNGELMGLNDNSGVAKIQSMTSGNYDIVVDVLTVNELSIYPEIDPPKPWVAKPPKDFSFAVLWANYY